MGICFLFPYHSAYGMSDTKQRPPPAPEDDPSEEVNEGEDEPVDNEGDDADEDIESEVGVSGGTGVVEEPEEDEDPEDAVEDENEQDTLEGVRDVHEYKELQKVIKRYMIKMGCTTDDLRAWEEANDRSMLSEKHFYYGIWAYLP